MSFGMYAASVPAFLQMLKNLTAILEKAEAFAEERDIEPEVMLNWRLAPDMFPLVRQIQIAADFAKGTTARLAGAEVPKYADEEQTFAELKARIAKTVKFVEGFKPKDIDGSETRDITLAVGGQEMRFKGEPYLVHFAPPNFYLSCDDRLRHPAPLRSRYRQTRFHRHDLLRASQAVVVESLWPRKRKVIATPEMKPPICAM
jgi:hypothetical protein